MTAPAWRGHTYPEHAVNPRTDGPDNRSDPRPTPAPDASLQQTDRRAQPTPGATAAYRADIDGLRALAVIAVVVFHAYRRQVTGGFIGVDVFFVISGYLISGIIWKELERGAF